MYRQRLLTTVIFTVLAFFLIATPLIFAELLNDGSFENVPSSWEEYYNTSCSAVSIGNWVSVGGPAAVDGQQTLWAGGACTNGVVANNGARQDITLEPDAALLSFWYFPIKATDPVNSDFAIVALDELPIWQLSVDGISASSNWNNAIVDISNFAGQTTTLSLEMQHDNDGDVAHVFFDYIEVLHPEMQISQVILPSLVLAGEPFEVEITIENSGDSQLNNIAVTNSIFADCDRAAGTIPDLDPGESSAYTCNVANAAEEMENLAEASATTTEIEYPVEASDTATPDIADPTLELDVDPGTATIEEGETVRLTLTISNNGNVDLADVQVTSNPSGGCNLSLGTLNAQQTAVFNCNYTPVSSGTINFTATAVEPASSLELSTQTSVTIEFITPPTFPSYTLFLPATTNGFINHNAVGEPNDTCDQAYPITPNQTAEFFAENVHDWYSFTLNTSGNISVDLTNFIPIAGQITLWRGSCQSPPVLIGQNGDFSSQKSINLTNQAPGTYHVWLINDGPLNSTNKYSLTVTTP